MMREKPVKQWPGKRAGLHYGIFIVLACILIEGTGQGILLNTFNVFVKPVTEDLGFGRGAFALYSTICTGLSVLLLPLFGRIFQGKYAGLAIRVCAVAAALVPLGYSVSEKLFQFYFFGVLSGIFINGVGMTMAGTVVGYWFREKRGLATGIAFAGSGIMGAAAVPLITWTIASFGWRTGYRAVALASLALFLPSAFFLLRVRPEDCGLRPYGEEGDTEKTVGSGVTRAQALRTRALWLLLPAIFLGTVSTQAIYGNSLAYFSDLGYGTGVTGMAGSLMYAVLAVGRVGAGWVFDRIGAFRAVMILQAMLIATGVLYLLAGCSTLLVFAAVISLGMVSGGVALIPSHWVRAYFGDKEFSSIYAAAMVPIQLAVAAGPLLGASIFDWTGSYRLAWTLGIAAAAAAWGLFGLSKYFSEKEITI